MRRFLRLFSLLLLLAALIVVWGCYPLLHSPSKLSQAERFDLFPSQPAPLSQPTSIRWNSFSVPYVVAESDSDAFFALGASHAHLRLGQMTLLKHVASGRLSELAGPFTTDIDHALRILQFGKAGKEILAGLRPDTRKLIDSFVAGINWYQDNTAKLPSEFTVFDLEPEPWSAEDVVLLSRLAGTDLSWLFYVGMFILPPEIDRKEAWERYLSLAQLSPVSFGGGDAAAFLADHSRSGSNSIAVSKQKSASGSALMANDPHLGIQIPNFWLIAGVKSPSFEVVGMMIPGVPFFALGRNSEISWGGTNMRSISSHLFELSPAEKEKLKSKSDTVKVRWWFDREITVRESERGPILSDAPSFKGIPDLSLSWAGHEGDGREIEAFLDANRASNWSEFREAFQDYSVSGQNILYADSEGNIGHLLAYRQPILDKPEETLELWKSSDRRIVDYRGPLELPFAFNPPAGFLASANNRPTETEIPLSFSYGSGERFRRLQELASSTEKISVSDLKAWQRDTYSKNAYELKEFLLDSLSREAIEASSLLSEIDQWDGHYKPEHRGAAAYEIFVSKLVDSVLPQISPEEELRRVLTRGAAWYRVVRKHLEEMSQEERGSTILQSVREAEEDYTGQSWGEMHRLRLRHPLGRVPLIGSRYRFLDLPAAGSNTTLLKSGHGLTSEVHGVTYGAQSRHVSDLSDIDENYFVLLGGQDGWLKSPANTDQVPLWQEGQYIRMPLREDEVEELFSQVVTIR